MTDNEITNSIQKALIKLMSESESNKIKASDLVKYAHVSRSTFYRYYNSVDDVLLEIEDNFIDGLRKHCQYYVLPEITFYNIAKPASTFCNIAKYIYDKKEIFLVMSSSYYESKRFLDKWNEVGKEYWIGKYTYEKLNIKLLDLYTEFILAGMIPMVRYWLTQHDDLSYEEMAVIAQRFLFGAFSEIKKSTAYSSEIFFKE